jgi:hypothetical protein
LNWIENTRKRGNELVSDSKLEDALNEYMKCLVALDFKSCKAPKPSDEQVEMAERGVKVPVLNNMALCL